MTSLLLLAVALYGASAHSADTKAMAATVGTASRQTSTLQGASSNEAIRTFLKVLFGGNDRLSASNQDDADSIPVEEYTSMTNATYSINAAEEARIKSDAKITGTKSAPQIKYSSSSSMPSAFQAFYAAGGSIYSNPKTTKEDEKPPKKDALGLYYAGLTALYKQDYQIRQKQTLRFLGIQKALPGVTVSDMSALRTWLRKSNSQLHVGELSNYIEGYPGIENDQPLDALGAMDTNIEHVYRVGKSQYVISAIAYYGELKRFGYDIGLEYTNKTWVVHFVNQMWSA